MRRIELRQEDVTGQRTNEMMLPGNTPHGLTRWEDRLTQEPRESLAASRMGKAVGQGLSYPQGSLGLGWPCGRASNQATSWTRPDCRF